MDIERRHPARTSLLAIGRACTATAVALALGASLGTAATGTARADSLDEQQRRLEAAIAVSQASLGRHQQAASTAAATLDRTRGRLAERQQVLAEAQQAWQQAAAEDHAMAARLSSARKALAAATKRADDNQKALDAELRLASATLSNLQQANPLTSLAVFTNDLDPADVNQRSQWAEQSATLTQEQALHLAELQRQLREARAQQAAATAAVAEQRREAAEHLQQTTELEATARAEAAAVAAQERLDAAEAADARARVEAGQQQAAALRQQSAAVNQQIAARNEAIRQARIRAEQEAARRAAAARAAAARAEAARREAARAAADRAAAEEAARRAEARAAAASQEAAARAEARAAAARAAEDRAARARESADREASDASSAMRLPRVVRAPRAVEAPSQSAPRAFVSTDVGGYAGTVAGGEVDPWGFYSYECVSYAAYIVRTSTAWSGFQNNYRGAHFGNAVEWAAAARQIGVPVDTHPSVGAVAWRASGRAGHVAIVTAVHDDGTIDIAEYNLSGGYHQFGQRRWVDWTSGGTWGFDGFIHFESTQP